MTDEHKLTIRKREKLGTAESRRLRKRGNIPGSIYGLQGGSVSVVADEDKVVSLVNSGTRVVEVDLEGTIDTVLFREVQWDTFGKHVEHFDLQRIDPTQRVTVDVDIDVRGISPGVLAGGHLELSLRSVTIDCVAVQIPSSIPARIGSLQIDDAIRIRDLPLPPGATALADAETLVLRVVAAQEELEEVEGEEQGPVQPELIGRKPGDEEAEGSEGS